MSTIEKSIEQLEKATSKIKQLAVEENQAIKIAVREAEKDARKKVEETYAKRRAAVEKEMASSKQEIKNAQARISKALRPSSNGTAARVPKGYREQQILTIVKNKPEVRQADIAKEIGVHQSTVGPVVKRLVEQNKLKVDGDRRYRIA